MVGFADGSAGAAHGAFYGNELAALAQLEIEFSDGHVQTVATNESWTAGPSAVVSNDLYDGQTIDARRYSAAWLQPGFSNQDWTGVHQAELDFATLDSVRRSPARRREELRAAQDLDLSGRQDAGRFRAEPRRVGAAGSARPGRHDRYPPAR